MNTTGIYRIYNKFNGKSYVGATTNLTMRIKGHFRLLRANSHNSKLQNAYNKNPNAIAFEILEHCNYEDLQTLEIYYFNKFNAINEGYNFKTPLQNSPYVIRTQETKDKIAASRIGQTHSQQTKQKISISRKIGNLRWNQNNQTTSF